MKMHNFAHFYTFWHTHSNCYLKMIEMISIVIIFMMIFQSLMCSVSHFYITKKSSINVNIFRVGSKIRVGRDTWTQLFVVVGLIRMFNEWAASVVLWIPITHLDFAKRYIKPYILKTTNGISIVSTDGRKYYTIWVKSLRRMGRTFSTS